MGDRRLNKRIPVYNDTQTRLRDFAYGGGATYDEVINFLLSAIQKPGEDDMSAGRRLRTAIDQHKQDTVQRAS
jgi:hypothetical protein